MSDERRAGRDRRQNTAAYHDIDRRNQPDRRHAPSRSVQTKQPGGNLRFSLVTLVLFLIIWINLPEGMLVRLGLEPNILFAALFAVALSGMVMHKNMAIVLLVILLSIGANLPNALAEQYSINRDYLMAALIGVAILPMVKGWFE